MKRIMASGKTKRTSNLTSASAVLDMREGWKSIVSMRDAGAT